ncbi:biotin transporter BioY [Agrobacterium cavarae]|uniref:biotin transporter BioY n=1 Tax=Agrobacterium cavarae TaxID=2528239 RepID=UPI003EE6D82D
MIRTDISSFVPVTRSLPRQAFMIVAGVALMTLAAKTQVPFWPVPMTLHTLAVMGFAVAFGPRMACAIFIAYLATGAAGLPVFSGSPERGIGLAYMIGPTGGYLAGFLVASWLTGWLAQNGTLLRRLFAMLAGLVVVYAFGMAWLLAFVPAAKVLSVGVAPFILGDLGSVPINGVHLIYGI